MNGSNDTGLVIFFECYGDHRDLHSFPTRRSSDLRLLGQQHGQRMDLLASGAAGAPHPHRRSGARPDRKSTRLNSSHANISYAVFCLKKKKKNEQNNYPSKKKNKKKKT